MKLKIFTLLFFTVLLFGCSDDDGKNDNKTEIEYYLRVESPVNYIIEIKYKNPDGSTVVVPTDSNTIKLEEGNLVWSKKIKVDVPFDAELSVEQVNTSNIEIRYSMSIFKGDDVMEFYIGRVEPGLRNVGTVDVTIAE